MAAFRRTINVVFVAVVLLSSQCFNVNGDQVESTPSYDILIRNQIPTLEVAIRSQKVFRFQFNPNLFGWSNLEGAQDSVSRHQYTYQPSLKGLPDMPYWMRYKYSHRHKAGFIYGVPPNLYPNHQLIEMDVVALNHGTFDTGLLHLVINVTQAEENEAAKRCVRLKIDNLNLEDIFDAHRLRNLKGIFKHHLWKNASKDLHLTFIASSIDVGYRRPVIPSEKDGVVLQLGSNSNFSEELLELNRETTPLRKFKPRCPRNFKRTSVERHFREKTFALDWCAFRLMELNSVHLPSKTWEMFKEIDTIPENVYGTHTSGEFNTLDDESGDYDYYTNSSSSNNDNNKSNQEDRRTDSAKENSIYSSNIDSSSSHDAMLYLKSKLQEFPSRSNIPVRKFTQEFVLSTVPIIVVFIILFVLFFGIFCTKDSTNKQQHRDGDYSVETLPWDGFVESFFLVLKDCVSCCNVLSISDKDLQNPLISAQEKFQVKLRMAEKQQKEIRSRRESSVQRQTDSLRRLAATRDVTPRLQSPRHTNSLLILGDNQSLASEPVIAGSINIPIASNPSNINNYNTIINGNNSPARSQHFDTLNRPKNFDIQDMKRRSANYAYDAFQPHYVPDARPAPPPYMTGDPIMMETYPGAAINIKQDDDDEGTYLV